MVVCYSKLSEGRQGHVTKYLGMQSPIENCKNAEVGKMLVILQDRSTPRSSNYLLVPLSHVFRFLWVKLTFRHPWPPCVLQFHPVNQLSIRADCTEILAHHQRAMSLALACLTISP